jgi:CRP-like cAMP-binding protein
MEFKAILSNINKHIQFTREEADYFTSQLTRVDLNKKEFLIKEGAPCTTFNYVQQGALRAYYRDSKGNNNIIMFALPDWWVTDMYSFVNKKPAMLNIDALEDSVILQLRKTDLDKLFIKIPSFERFFRILMQNAYIREQLRVIENLSRPAEERYENFLAKYPQVAQRVPLKQIASYLGITPEFLSVVRKKARKK